MRGAVVGGLFFNSKKASEIMPLLLCALAGLVLGFALAVWTQHAALSAAVPPFGVCLAAHLAACALGSGVFAWLCARKYVLAQLQAKE